MKNISGRLSLVADVGGTNTRMAFADGATLLPETVTRFRNAEFETFNHVMRKYLAEAPNVDCTAVCVAVAGPVGDGTAKLTNLDWNFDVATLKSDSGAPVASLLNDLGALAYALDGLDVSGQVPVVAGTRSPIASDAKLVLGAGTGCNAAALVPGIGRQGRLVNPAECGHVAMPVQSDADCRLMNYLRSIDGFASVEDVLSGPGLENCYGWASKEAGDENRIPASEVAARLADRSDPVALAAGRAFARVAAMETGNLALTFLPYGGIYLAGGAMRAIAPYFAEFGFSEAFYDKGRFSKFLEKFSVWIVEDDFAALSGCAAYANQS